MAFPAIGAILSRITQFVVGRTAQSKGLAGISKSLQGSGAEVAAAQARGTAKPGGESVIDKMVNAVVPPARRAGAFVMEDEDAPDNARALTRALSQGVPTNPSRKSYPAYAADPSKMTIAPQPGVQPESSEQQRPDVRSADGGQPQQPEKRRADEPVAPPVVNQPPPRPPQSKGGVRDRIGRFVQGMQHQREQESRRRREIASLRKPIDTSRLPLAQRRQRLETAGRLLSEEGASKVLGGVEIKGIKQVVQASEKAEQRSRNKEAKRLEDLPPGAGPLGKLIHKFKWVSLVSAAAIGLVAGFLKLRGTLRRSGEAHAEAQRKFARYNMIIATTMARLDRQNIVLEARTARTTGGSSQMAVAAKMWADRMGQQNRETLQTVINGISAGIQVGRGILEIASQLSPLIQQIAWVAKQFEQMAGEAQPNEHVFIEAMRDFIAEQDNRGEGRNHRPGGIAGRGGVAP